VSERGISSLNHNFYLSERQIFLRGELDSSGKTGGEFFAVAAGKASAERRSAFPSAFGYPAVNSVTTGSR
jgi:hypothetical protein